MFVDKNKYWLTSFVEMKIATCFVETPTDIDICIAMVISIVMFTGSWNRLS